jgi:phosphonate transport system substrate-binding protein
VPEGSVKHDLESFQPLLKELRNTLGIPVETVLPSSYGSVIEGLLAGTIDLARLGPAAYVSAKSSDPDIKAFATNAQRAGAFQEEGPFYRSLLIVSTSRTTHTIGSLRGKRLALVDPDSTSGAVIPRKLFADVLGMPLDRHFGRISYAGNHDAAAMAVRENRVDAAFVSSYHLSSLVSSGKAKQMDFKVLWQSPAIPTDPFVYRDNLCKSIKDKIESVFFRRLENDNAMHDNGAARVYLPVTDRDYQVIRNLMQSAQ